MTLCGGEKTHRVRSFREGLDEAAERPLLPFRLERKPILGDTNAMKFLAMTVADAEQDMKKNKCSERPQASQALDRSSGGLANGLVQRARLHH